MLGDLGQRRAPNDNKFFRLHAQSHVTSQIGYTLIEINQPSNFLSGRQLEHRVAQPLFLKLVQHELGDGSRWRSADLSCLLSAGAEYLGKPRAGAG